MLEQVHEAVRVEDVATGEARARLGTELRRVADGAELVLVDTLEVANLLGAGRIEAWKTLALLGDAFAGMATGFVSLLAELDFWLIFLLFFLIRKLLKLGGRILSGLLDLGRLSSFLHHFLH